MSDSAVLDLPSTREEAWRWSDLSGLEALAQTPHSEAHEPAMPFIGEAGPRLVFVDGTLNADASTLGPIAIEQLDLATDHPLGRQATGLGWSLTLGREHATAPIQIVHIATGGANHLPGRIVLEEDAVASITETFVGSGWSNRLTPAYPRALGPADALGAPVAG